MRTSFVEYKLFLHYILAIAFQKKSESGISPPFYKRTTFKEQLTSEIVWFLHSALPTNTQIYMKLENCVFLFYHENNFK